MGTSKSNVSIADLPVLKVPTGNEIMSQPSLIETGNRLFTGPIDDVSEHSTNIQCPNCNGLLTYIQEQSGACHSGLFWNSCIEHYSCGECEGRFLEQDATQNSIKLLSTEMDPNDRDNPEMQVGIASLGANLNAAG